MIPAYNAEAQLGRALRSVLDQTLPAHETIVVDDGSTDQTGRIARGFGGHVRCIGQANAGAAAARNAGIARAEGELVAFLDADDEWLPHHLAQAAAIFGDRPELVWYSAAHRWQELSGGFRRAAISPRQIDRRSLRNFFEAASDGWTCYTPTMVIRRSVLSEQGGFDESLPTGEDIDLWFRIALRHPEIGYGAQPSVIIHSTPGSLTTRGLFTRARAEQLADRWEALAIASDRHGDPGVRSYLLRGLIEALLRPALAGGDRDAAGWILQRFERELPVAWRVLAKCMLVLPEGLWSLAASAWARSRAARARLKR